MKKSLFSIFICLFILISIKGYAQYKLTKDLNRDGTQDSIIYNPATAQIRVDFSGRNTTTYLSKPVHLDTKVVGLEKIKDGFQFYAYYEDVGVKYLFKFNNKTGKIRLTGLSHSKFGPGNKDGLGISKLNLLTNEFTGKWKYFDLKKREQIKMPTVKESISYPDIFLAQFDGSIGHDFETQSKNFFLFEKQKILEKGLPPEKIETVKKTEKLRRATSWKGAINDQIAILLILQEFDKIKYGTYGKLVVGKINYLNERKEESHFLVGYLDAKGDYNLKEYGRKGKILSIIRCSQNQKILTGGWRRPTSDEFSNLILMRENIAVPPIKINADPTKIIGKYAYQYREKGNMGELEVNRTNGNKTTLSMVTMSGPPVRKITNSIHQNLIPTGKTIFNHRVPQTAGCVVHLQFFKKFVLVNYTEGSPCRNSSGGDSGYEEIYYKVE